MASRYWVGGTASWDATAGTKWSTTSGGAGGAAVPTASDDVFFNGSSGSGTCSVTAVVDCLSIDFTGYIGTLDLTNQAVNVNGSLKLASGMTLANTSGAFQMAATSGSWNVTCAGKALLGGTTFGSTGTSTATWTLQDALSTTSTLSLSAGTLDFNNKNVSCDGFDSNNSNTRALKLGTGTLTITGTGTVWSLSTTTGMTLTPSSSTIKITDSSASNLTFAGGGLTYNNLWWARGASTALITHTGSNTFNDLKDTGTAAHSLRFTAGTTTTVTTFTVSGSSGNVITINSQSTATHALTKSAGGTISGDWLNIQHSVASPGTTWYAGSNSTNNQATATAGSGWIFTTPPATAIFLAARRLTQAINRASSY